jgi:UPF0755 protein
MPSDFYYRERSVFPGRLQIIALFGGVALVVAVIAAYCFANAAWYRTPSATRPPDVSIVVAEGSSFAQVAADLGANDIASPFWIRVYTKLFDDPTVYPGNYVVTPGMSYQAVMAELHGHDADSVRITIPEGFSLVEMGARINTVLPEISIAEWAAATSATSTLARDPFVVSSGKPAGVDLEGYLFPDTYEFLVDATAEHIAETMLRTMETRLSEIGAATGDAEGMSMHELLTLSSIVEKEVRTAETMKNVADVFLKRLDIGMALQSDATINYIIDGDDPSPLYSDLEVESPYNTYKHPGLPPGPISAPGLNALNAVLHPAENSYFYFLTTDEGAIYYAETYEEHLRNKARWLK